MNEKLLTMTEAGKLLRVSRQTVSKYITSKRLKACDISGNGRCWRIKLSDVEEFLSATAQ